MMSRPGSGRRPPVARGALRPGRGRGSDPPMLLAHLTVIASTALGWSDITVAPSRGERAHASFQRTLAGLDRPSERTVETLKRYEVERTYRRNVDHALATLEKVARANPEPEVVYALAELSWLEGRRL